MNAMHPNLVQRGEAQATFIANPYDQDSRGFLRGFVTGVPGHRYNATPLDRAKDDVRLHRNLVVSAKEAVVLAEHNLRAAEHYEAKDPIPFPPGRGPVFEATRTLARLMVELRRAELRFEQAEEILRSEEIILEAVL